MKPEKLKKELQKIDPGITAYEKDGCICLEGEVDDWQKAVKAGQAAVDKKRYLGVLNDIRLKGFEQKLNLPSVNDYRYDGTTCDVLVIGGGVTGCAVARELSRYRLRVMVVEKGADVGSGQSSRNGGVLHTGMSFSKDSLKLRYCLRGNDMYRRLSKELHVPYENKGQVTFAGSEWEMTVLRYLQKNAIKKGIVRTKIMTRDELREIEPSVPDWCAGGLFMGTGGITSPHRMTIALAENAVENGAVIALETAVLGMTVEDHLVKEVRTNRGTIYPKAVVNAAGVWADVIAEMAEDRTFTIHPRIGTDLVTDKKAGWMANTSFGKSPFTLSPAQKEGLPKGPAPAVKAILKNMSSHSKGIGFIHAAEGNMLVGPNADEVPDREDTSTDRKTVEHIIEMQREIQPEFKASDIIAYFTGVRSPMYEEDFVVRPGIRTKNIFEAAGIQSPGLTAAPAIAEDIAEWVKAYLETVMRVEKNLTFDPVRKYSPVLSEMSPEERDRLIKEDPDYGEIVCRCEVISKGEIRDALRSPLPVYTVDGVKRRVRPGMGRCQGSFCLPAVMKLIAEESGKKYEDIVKSSKDSRIVFPSVK